MSPTSPINSFNMSDRKSTTSRQVAAAIRFDPFTAYNFRIEIGGVIVGGCSEVSGLEIQVETIDHREGGVNDHVHQLPAQARQSNLTLRKGIGGVDGLWSWFHDVTQGIIARKYGTVMMVAANQIPVMWWTFANAYPVRWTGPELDATSGNVAFQSFELVHDGLTQPAISSAAAAAAAITLATGHA